MNGDVSITRATVEDAEQVLALIHRAFTPVAILYNDPTLPPVTESLHEHRACYETRVVLKAEDGGGRIVRKKPGPGLRNSASCLSGSAWNSCWTETRPFLKSRPLQPGRCMTARSTGRES